MRFISGLLCAILSGAQIFLNVMCLDDDDDDDDDDDVMMMMMMMMMIIIIIIHIISSSTYSIRPTVIICLTKQNYHL